jgi:hypothetical protein
MMKGKSSQNAKDGKEKYDGLDTSVKSPVVSFKMLYTTFKENKQRK